MIIYEDMKKMLEKIFIMKLLVTQSCYWFV